MWAKKTEAGISLLLLLLLRGKQQSSSQADKILGDSESFEMGARVSAFSSQGVYGVQLLVFAGRGSESGSLGAKPFASGKNEQRQNVLYVGGKRINASLGAAKGPRAGEGIMGRNSRHSDGIPVRNIKIISPTRTHMGVGGGDGRES